MYTLLLVVISWVIFSIEDLSLLGSWLQTMFGLNGAPLVSTDALFYLKNYATVIVFGIIASLPWKPVLQRRLAGAGGQRLIRVAQPVLLVGLFTICMAFLVSDTYNPFLYFRF